MKTVERSDGHKLVRRALGSERTSDLLRLVGTVTVFLILDRLLRRTARLQFEDGSSSSLAVAAVERNWFPCVVLLVGITGFFATLRNGKWRDGWHAMDHGDTLRWLALPWIVIAAWSHSAYPFNPFFGEWHSVDRLLVIGFGLAAMIHPLFLVPFAFQARVIAAQFAIPFGATLAESLAQLTMIGVIIIVATFMIAVVGDNRNSSPGVWLTGVAVAAHFFAPGRAKIGIGWLSTTELHQFAFSSYTAGWQGGGDGAWARWVADLMTTLEWPILLGTMLLELGAIAAVVHSRLLRWWLPGWIALHAAIFAVSGFWLLEWVVVELSLLILLWRPNTSDWIARNNTIPGAFLAVAIVVASPIVFQPPKLAWLDAPVSYSYEVNAVGASGATYHIELDEFGVGKQDLNFLFAGFTSRPLAVGGYGATAGADFYARLQSVRTFDELRELERLFDPLPDEVRSRSEHVIVRWLEHANALSEDPWYLISPPARYWLSRPSPTYDGSERLVRVDVILVRSIHTADDQMFERERVLRVGADANDVVTVIERAVGDEDE